MKIANTLLFAAVSVIISSCNNGVVTPSNTIPVPTPTSPVAMPTSTWVNTHLDTYLTTSGLEKLNTGLAVDNTGVYVMTRTINTQMRKVLFYNYTTQAWSDITGNLTPYTITSTSSTGGVSTNGNGVFYTTTTTSTPATLNIYTGNNIWQNISLPVLYPDFTTSTVEAQTRKIFVLANNASLLSAGTPITYQPYELTSTNTLSTILSPVTSPSGAESTVSAQVSPSGNYYYTLFNFKTPAHKQLSVNGVLYSESLPASGYSQSSISNNGYSYAYPNSASGQTIIYECANGHCLPITSANNIRKSGDFILSLTPLATSGSFSVSLSNSATAVSSTYICNSAACTQLGNIMSESVATPFYFNPYITNPINTAYGVGSGFYWLESGLWTNLAPTINDGNGVGAFADSVSVACSYSQATPLLRFILSPLNAFNNRNQSLYVNTTTAWTNISESIVPSGTYTSYSSMVSAVSPSTGASTFAGMAAFIKTDESSPASNNVVNLWLYPINTVVCPGLY